MPRLFVLNADQHEQKAWGKSLVVGATAPSEGPDGTVGEHEFLKVFDNRVSGLQLQLQAISGSEIELQNFGRSIALNAGPRIHRGRKVKLKLPVSFCIGDSQFQIVSGNSPAGIDDGLVCLSMIGSQAIDEVLGDEQSSPNPSTLEAWFESLSDLQKEVAGSHELFELACRALFNPGGLDGGFVLVPSESDWQIAASHIPFPDHGIGFREDLVQRAASERTALYHDAKIVDSKSSFRDLHSAVVCPIFGPNDKVFGVLYGMRSLHRRNSRRGIRRLEAQFARLVADSISSGVYRLDSEADAARSKVLLEQVFSPRVANKLQNNSEILKGKETEVSILFADMRGFSGISEKVGATMTYDLLSSVMDEFTKIITDLDGVIIDFYGDGVSAFWNAPIPQPEHAVFACQAALEMLESLHGLNQEWRGTLGQEIQVGIGVNTGITLVGNSGSSNRLKYGPRGHVVNVASRLENATKAVGIPLLISRETAEFVKAYFKCRRVCNLSLKGLASPTGVYQVFNEPNLPPPISLERYEAALGMFEARQFGSATDILVELSELYPFDLAVKYLLEKSMASQSANDAYNDGTSTLISGAFIEEPGSFDPMI